MVVFTCQHCGSSLAKTKVEKHYNYECRKSPFVTCVDCLKDFLGDSYVAHTQCITQEEQRYGPKDYVSKIKPSVKKRATWLSSVESVLELPDLSQDKKRFIESIVQFSNIPNKKNKFFNFVKSVFARQAPSIEFIDEVFDLFDQTHKKNIKIENAQNNSENSNQINQDNFVDKKIEENNGKKSKKRLRSENGNNLEDVVPKNQESESVVNENSEEYKKLSKKEKKELKKRAKYEAQLKSVETENLHAEEENEEENIQVEDNVDKSKKKKKNKSKKASFGDDVVEGNNKKKTKDEADDIKENNEPRKKKNRDEADDSKENNEPSKKKKKEYESEQLNDSINEDDERKFSWTEAIVKVLESKSNELPLKRLSKKIINEYQAVYGETHMTYEKLMGKFNKKLHKIPCVRVFKDKAVLIPTS